MLPAELPSVVGYTAPRGTDLGLFVQLGWVEPHEKSM